jgi:hypothetical protein
MSASGNGEIARCRPSGHHHAGVTATLLFVGVLLVACGERDVPPAIDHPPAVTPLPIAIGVYYPPEFRTWRCTVKTLNTSEWGRDTVARLYATAHVIGPSQVAAFDLVFPAMFQVVVPLEAPPPAPAPTGLTATITVGVDQCLVAIDYDTVNVGRQGGSFASITYRFTLTTPSGEKIATWSVVGGGLPKLEGIFSRDVTSGPWLQAAIRDAVAKFVAGFDTEPALAAWRAQLLAQKAPP